MTGHPRGTAAVRLLAGSLPRFRGRDFLLYSAARVLNRSWPAAATYTWGGRLKFTLDLTDPNHRMIYLFDRFEEDLVWVISHLLERGDRVLEAGTNIGLYTAIIADRIGPDGEVLGFEPLDAARNAAALHLAANGFTNVRLLPLALGAEPGEASIFSFTDLPIGHASLSNLVPGRSVETRCEVTTIDRQVDGLATAIRFMKFDIEGSELPALRGAEQTIARDRPLLMVEANAETARPFGYAPSDVVRWIVARGYRPFIFDRRGWRDVTANTLPERSTNVLFVAETDHVALERIRA